MSKVQLQPLRDVVEAPAPPRPIPRFYTVPGLLAHVLVAEYCDHTPRNRRSEIYARGGVDLDRSTLAGRVVASAALLEPLIESVRHHVFAGTRVHANDTPVPCSHRATEEPGPVRPS